MPTFKLIYFDVRSRGETPRMLFKLAGQPFEDYRVSGNWPEVKKTVPMGQLPVLDVDGVLVCQSQAISRYLAKQFGYNGKTDLEAAQIDAVVGCVEDLTTRVLPIYDLKDDPEEKSKYQERYRNEFLYPGLTKLQLLLETNNGGNSFFIGDSLTWADVYFLNVCEYALYMGQADLENFSKLKALKERVEAVPQIAAWIKERPKTSF